MLTIHGPRRRLSSARSFYPIVNIQFLVIDPQAGKSDFGLKITQAHFLRIEITKTCHTAEKIFFSLSRK